MDFTRVKRIGTSSGMISLPNIQAADSGSPASNDEGLWIGMNKKERFSFTWLRPPDSLRERADWDESVSTAKIVCPLNPDHRGSGRRINELSVILRHEPDDVVWTYGSGECLIQEKVAEKWRDYGLTGFELGAVEACYYKSAAKPPKL